MTVACALLNLSSLFLFFPTVLFSGHQSPLSSFEGIRHEGISRALFLWESPSPSSSSFMGSNNNYGYSSQPTGAASLHVETFDMHSIVEEGLTFLAGSTSSSNHNFVQYSFDHLHLLQQHQHSSSSLPILLVCVYC